MHPDHSVMVFLTLCTHVWTRSIDVAKPFRMHDTITDIIGKALDTSDKEKASMISFILKLLAEIDLPSICQLMTEDNARHAFEDMQRTTEAIELTPPASTYRRSSEGSHLLSNDYKNLEQYKDLQKYEHSLNDKSALSYNFPSQLSSTASSSWHRTHYKSLYPGHPEMSPPMNTRPLPETSYEVYETNGNVDNDIRTSVISIKDQVYNDNEIQSKTRSSSDASEMSHPDSLLAMKTVFSQSQPDNVISIESSDTRKIKSSLTADNLILLDLKTPSANDTKSHQKEFAKTSAMTDTGILFESSKDKMTRKADVSMTFAAHRAHTTDINSSSQQSLTTLSYQPNEDADVKKSVEEDVMKETLSVSTLWTKGDKVTIPATTRNELNLLTTLTLNQTNASSVANKTQYDAIKDIHLLNSEQSFASVSSVNLMSNSSQKMPVYAVNDPETSPETISEVAHNTSDKLQPFLSYATNFILTDDPSSTKVILIHNDTLNNKISLRNDTLNNNTSEMKISDIRGTESELFLTSIDAIDKSKITQSVSTQLMNAANENIDGDSNNQMIPILVLNDAETTPDANSLTKLSFISNKIKPIPLSSTSVVTPMPLTSANALTPTSNMLSINTEKTFTFLLTNNSSGSSFQSRNNTESYAASTIIVNLTENFKNKPSVNITVGYNGSLQMESETLLPEMHPEEETQNESTPFPSYIEKGDSKEYSPLSSASQTSLRGNGKVGRHHIPLFHSQNSEANDGTFPKEGKSAVHSKDEALIRPYSRWWGGLIDDKLHDKRKGQEDSVSSWASDSNNYDRLESLDIGNNVKRNWVSNNNMKTHKFRLKEYFNDKDGSIESAHRINSFSVNGQNLPFKNKYNVPDTFHKFDNSRYHPYLQNPFASNVALSHLANDIDFHLERSEPSSAIQMMDSERGIPIQLKTRVKGSKTPGKESVDRKEEGRLDDNLEALQRLGLKQKTIWSESVPRGYLQSSGNSCPGLFGYFGDADDCHSFFICSWGLPFRFYCPAGTLWNQAITVCDWPRNVDCSQK